MERNNDGKLHFSELKKIAHLSPKHFRHYCENPPEDTRSFRMGRMAHRAWLLEDISTIPVWTDGKRDARNPEYAAALARNGGETLLNSDEYRCVLGMYDALSKDPHAAAIKARCTHFEKYVTWELLGVPMAGTIDLCGPGILADPKSCEPGRIRPEAFQRQGARYGYPEQIALYDYGEFECTHVNNHRPRSEWPESYNIAVENAEPFDVVVHRLSPLLLDNAFRTACEWVQLWKECQANGTWPGHGSQIVDWNIDPDKIAATELDD